MPLALDLEAISQRLQKERPRLQSVRSTTPLRRRTTGSFEVERTTGTHEVLDRLFVYGTLRQGQTARSIIANQITRTG